MLPMSSTLPPALEPLPKTNIYAPGPQHLLLFNLILIILSIIIKIVQNIHTVQSLRRQIYDFMNS